MTTRYKRPDPKNALSIILAADREMHFTLTLKLTTNAASTIIRNVYECFRMLGDALLVARGIESMDHQLPIQELIRLKVDTSRPIFLLDNLRRLRHQINYYGYSPSLPEAVDAVSFAKSCFKPLNDAVLTEIGRKNP
ncbi:hypothetical protein HY495_03555 [Candidatus Woesearchaeota archaeon]|nr:hypothetical protein [Candidatus Woesearchaeota archaeon]